MTSMIELLGYPRKRLGDAVAPETLRPGAYVVAATAADLFSGFVTGPVIETADGFSVPVTIPFRHEVLVPPGVEFFTVTPRPSKRPTLITRLLDALDGVDEEEWQRRDVRRSRTLAEIFDSKPQLEAGFNIGDEGRRVVLGATEWIVRVRTISKVTRTRIDDQEVRVIAHLEGGGQTDAKFAYLLPDGAPGTLEHRRTT